MTRVQLTCPVCRLTQRHRPSEMVIYPDSGPSFRRLLWCCHECGELNRTRLCLNQAMILVASGSLEATIDQIAPTLLEDETLEREIASWAAVI